MENDSVIPNGSAKLVKKMLTTKFIAHKMPVLRRTKLLL